MTLKARMAKDNQKIQYNNQKFLLLTSTTLHLSICIVHVIIGTTTNTLANRTLG